MKSYPTLVRRLFVILTLFSLTARGAIAAPNPVGGDAALKRQIAELQAKTRQLEAALSAKGPAASPSPGMSAINTSTAPSPASSMPGLPAGGAGNSGAMGGMMGMMNQMMGMGTLPAAPPGMAMSPTAIPQSALPGFPSVSHLYHIGTTGFFIDHAQHINLTADQLTALNKMKEAALTAKTNSDHQIEQGEQELGILTSSDQPDAAKIETKVREIEKLRVDERISFIRAVGDAAKLLTDDQRKILTGAMQPAMAPSPAATMSPMEHM